MSMNMGVREKLNYWSWASQFVLDRPIPEELLDFRSSDYSEEKLDEFIAANKKRDFADFSVDFLWESFIDPIALQAWKDFK